MKNKIILAVIGCQLFDDGGAVLITKPSKENPSQNGVHKLNAGQFRRIVKRCVGVENAIGFKHLIEMSNGTAKLSIDAELIKAGDTYVTKEGETKTYEGAKDADGKMKGDGSWTKHSNHEVTLGVAAQIKLTELSLAHSFANAQAFVQPKVAAPAQEDTQV